MKNSIKVQRAINDLTQQQLAEKIGVSRQTINAIETQKYIPSTTLPLKLAKLFGKIVEDIFELESEDLTNVTPISPTITPQQIDNDQACETVMNGSIAGKSRLS